MFKKLSLAVALTLGLAAPAWADGTIDTLSSGSALTGTESIPMFQTANPAVKTTPSAIGTYYSALSITETNKTLTSPTINTPTINGGSIGATTPGTGAFTTLSATGNLTTNVTGGGTQCLHVSNSGVVSGTGSDCGTGTGAVSITSGTPYTLAVSPSPLTSTGTISTTQGTADCTSGTGSCTGGAIVTALQGAWVLVGAYTYTLAQAGTTGFAAGWGVCLLNTGSGDATINATTSVFAGYGGGTSMVLHKWSWACPTSDGTNYQTLGANPNVTAGTNITATQNTDGTTTIAATGGLSGMTTGQVPIAASASTVTSSKALTNASGTKIQTSSGTLTNGDCAQFNASGDVVDAGGACGTGSGNTTSTSLTTNRLPKANGVNSIIDSSVSDNGTSVTTTEPTVFNNTVSIANEGSTGTTVNLLAKLTGAPSTAIKITTSDMSGISGVVVAGAGTTGNALIVRSGQASCVFDGATTAGDYVQASTTTAGDCHDAGSAYPTNGQVLGRVLSTNGSGGTYSMNVIGAEVNASNPVATASGGSVTLTGPQEVYFCTGTCTATLPALVVGQEYCVANNAAVTSVITLAALGGSAVYEKTDWSGYGTAGTGTLTSGGAAGDSICLHVLDTTHVQVMSSHGTWTAS